MNHDAGCYTSAGVGSQTLCTIHDCFNTYIPSAARPVRLPHAHPGRPSRGETTPRLASSNKKESVVDATIISSSFLVSAEVERMAHWSAYGSRVFYHLRARFLIGLFRVNYDAPTGNRTPISTGLSTVIDSSLDTNPSILDGRWFDSCD